MLALVYAFMLLGCSPRQDSDDPETNTRGSHDRHNSSEGQMSSSENKGTDAVEQGLIVVDELAWGYMQARLGAGGNEGRLFPIRTPADYEDFALAMSDDGYLELSQHFPQPPSFDPATHVLIFVELPDDAGTELRPGVEGIMRTNDAVRVLAYRTKNPNGAKTDNVTRSWVLIRAPKKVLEGDPGLRLELAERVR
jgi:hypothetical protein